MIFLPFSLVATFKSMLMTQSYTRHKLTYYKLSQHCNLTSIISNNGSEKINHLSTKQIQCFSGPIRISKHKLTSMVHYCIGLNKQYLGLWLDSTLSFKCHIDNIARKINFSTGVLYRNRNCFTFTVRKRLVQQLILPILDYADVIYQTAPKTHLLPLNSVYNQLCRFVLDCPYMTHHCTLYETLNLPSPTSRRHQHWLQFIFKCIYFNYPQYLKQLLVPYTSSHQLRHCSQIYFSTPTSSGKKAFISKAPCDWNNLPIHIRSITSFNLFKTALSSHLETTCSCFHVFNNHHFNRFMTQ